jgi:hypothetical protein
MKIDVVKAWVDDEKVYIQTKQGQVRSLDIASFRLLKKATPAQRQMFEVGKYGLHWPELDEDLSFEGFFSKDELCVAAKLEPIIEYVSISYIAARFFGKSRAWLHNKLNGNLSNGKPSSFTPEELEKLKNALDVIANEIKDAALKLSC